MALDIPERKQKLLHPKELMSSTQTHETRFLGLGSFPHKPQNGWEVLKYDANYSRQSLFLQNKKEMTTPPPPGGQQRSIVCLPLRELHCVRAISLSLSLSLLSLSRSVLRISVLRISVLRISVLRISVLLSAWEIRFAQPNCGFKGRDGSRSSSKVVAALHVLI